MANLIELRANGLTFQALTAGSAENELVLFLHGFPDFADSWLPIVERVAPVGYRCVAVDQRGYSPGARPDRIEDYATQHLVADVIGFADALGAERFHLAGHDWGGFVAWQVAAENPARVRSLCVLSTPHTNAFWDAIQTDTDQKQKSRYIDFFRIPGAAAESFFKADEWKMLRRVYQGKVPEARVDENVRRLSEPGALTAALNWYRALDLNARIGAIVVSTLFIWGSDDLAIGRVAASGTALYVAGSYRFEALEGKSHWLLDEMPEYIGAHLLQHLAAVRAADA